MYLYCSILSCNYSQYELNEGKLELEFFRIVGELSPKTKLGQGHCYLTTAGYLFSVAVLALQAKEQHANTYTKGRLGAERNVDYKYNRSLVYV